MELTQIDDITLLQLSTVWYAMADDLIHGSLRELSWDPATLRTTHVHNDFGKRL